jgi:hypothetical protein
MPSAILSTALTIRWFVVADEHKNGNGRTRWLVIAIPLLAAIAGVLGFMYAIGQRTSKIGEVVDWKSETAPRIERMDSQGTTSFKLFHDEYLRRQLRQEEEMDRMRQAIYDKQMADLKERILTLERKPHENSN